MKLIFASNNAHKLEEARAILPNLEIISLRELGCNDEIPETQPTLQGNSLQKAEYIYHWVMSHSDIVPKNVIGCFADDTGLEISALNGAPGVITARWSGPECDPAKNRKKALTELQGETNRAARFRTVVTLLRWADGPLTTDVFDGIVNGQIATEERGEAGFGYDPVFIPEGYDRTFAELPAEVKNTISHRARAMQQLAKALL